MFENENVVSVMRDLYVKTPKALKALLADLRRQGYEIQDLRKAEHRKERGTTVQEMEQNGWSLWYASLPDMRRGKCKSCNSLIDTRGIQSHGHKCEVCGEVTYYDLIDGSTLTFVFNNDGERGLMSPQLRLKVKRWDAENGLLYLYPEFLKGGLSVVTDKKAEDYFYRHTDKWYYDLSGESKIVVIAYTLQWNRDTAAIEPYDSTDHYWNHSIVKVWDGKEYNEYDHLPIPESMSIYEAWHWSPLPATPYLHEKILHAAGQVSDKGYYYQDGRQAFYSNQWAEMAKFVRHFTVLDSDKFDAAWPRFRTSGPGGIDDLARFCHDNPVVENKPNIGNTLVAMGKAIEGKPLAKNETEEAIRGAATPEGRSFLSGLLGRKR